MKPEIVSSTLNPMIRHNYPRKLPAKARRQKNALEALESGEYFEALKDYDKELEGLTEKIWQNEYLSV